MWIGRVAILAVASIVLLLVFLDMQSGYSRYGDRRRAQRTMSNIRALGTAVEAYAVQDGRFPSPPGRLVAGKGRKVQRSGGLQLPAVWPVLKSQRAAALESILSPRYVAGFPTADGWGYPLLYATTPDRRVYVIVSAGRDGELDPPETFARGAVWDSRRDLVYSNGGFLVWSW